MTKARIKRIYLCVAILICIALILASGITFMGESDDTASAYTTLPSGAISNLYDSTNKVFVRDNLDAIARKANYSDINAMITGTLNGNVKNASNFTKDTTVKLGTYYNLAKGAYEDLVWIPVYLSKDTTGKTAVLTLWLASADSTGQASNQERSTWTDGTYTASYMVKQNGMVANSYDGSYIRNVTLNNGSSYLGNWGEGTAVTPPDYTYPTKDKTKNKFVDFTTGDLSDYIVTPSQMPWQMAQDMLPNDPSWQGHKKDLSFSDQVLNCYPNTWTQDKIWLPAADDLIVQSTHTCRDLWGCSKEQKTSGHRLQSDTTEESYYRTVIYIRNGAPNQVHCQRVSSIFEEYNETIFYNIDNSYGECVVRPAIHLNLNAALDACALEVPKDVSVVGYTGLEQNFASLTKAPDWYDKDKMSVDFADGSTGKTDAGEYDMIATIRPDLAAKGLKFMGTAGAGETDTSRKFKFKIPKKKISVTLSLDNNVPKYSLANGMIYSGDTDANGRAPVFDFDYKNRISGEACSGYPTGVVGFYTATIKITNDCNYELDTATTLSIDFDIRRTPVDKPSIATKEKDYTGGDITFNLSQYSDKVSVTVTSSNGKSATHSGGVITVKDVGAYTVRIALADNGVSTCWKPPTGQTPANDDIDAYTISIEVKAKKLTPTITCSDTDASWDAGASQTMTITDDRLSDGGGNKDNIDYYVYYLKSGDSAKHDDIDKTKQVSGDSVIVTMPSDLAIGSYTFVVELRSNSSSSANGNYYIDGGSREMQFAVVGRGITVTPDSIKWKVNNADIGQLTNGKLLLTYTGNPFRFSIDESNLQSMGVKIDVSKGTNKGYSDDIEKTNAGTGYKVTVWLCNYDNTVATYSGSFSLNYDVQQAKYDLSGVTWNYTPGALKYNGNTQYVVLKGLPSSLSVQEYDGNSGRNAKPDYIATLLEFNNTNPNYMTPLLNQTDTYDGNFDWTLTWGIGKGELTLEWASTDIGKDFKVMQVTGTNAQYVDATKYKYYKSNGASVGDEIVLDDIAIGDSKVRYWVEAVLTDNASANYEISQTSKIKSFNVGSDNEKITVALSASSFTYDGNAHGGELRVTTGVLDIGRINKTYYVGSVSPENKLDNAPTDAGNYIVVLSLSSDDEEEYMLVNTQIPYSIDKAKITATWDISGNIPQLTGLSEAQKQIVGYIYYDEAGNELGSGAKLEAGKTYKVRAILTGDSVNNYQFVSTSGEVLPSVTQTDQQEFTAKASGGLGNNVGIDEDFNELWQKVKGMPLWQIIVGILSIILTIIFLSKTVGYDNKRKKFNKKADKLSTAYAGAYLGIATTIWTAIACVLMGLAVISFVMMMIAKSRCKKAEEEYEERLEEYNRNQKEADERKRDESMRMMLMGMMGGSAGGQGFGFANQGMSADDMRLMINDAVTAMLPQVQQYLPQPTAGNDDSIKQIIKTQEELAHNQELLMKKLANQPTEKIVGTVVAREVAVANANDETIKSLVEGQKTIMQQLAELSAKQNVEPKIIEKEVPVEKIVEKEVIKEVPIEVEKVVEKEVIKEVPVEVEKIVEKEVVKEVKVEVPVEAPKPKREIAPKLTLDEAYDKMTKQQKKFFDGLKDYAMSKDKCKEKKSTFFTVYGQTTTNPLLKLTIKKNVTVALFKMEDEFMKDIRRDATGDGTKVKVKETEIVVSDAQAFDTAKKMIDLREDQIERYKDLLREQRAIKK